MQRKREREKERWKETGGLEGERERERERRKNIYIERLAKETRADNVRVMVASGYFYIPDAPLKANVRDNASFPCTDRLRYTFHPLRFLVTLSSSPFRLVSHIRSRILHLLGECASARENSDGKGKRIRTTAARRAYVLWRRICETQRNICVYLASAKIFARADIKKEEIRANLA